MNIKLAKNLRDYMKEFVNQWDGLMWTESDQNTLEWLIDEVEQRNEEPKKGEQ